MTRLLAVAAILVVLLAALVYGLSWLVPGRGGSGGTQADPVPLVWSTFAGNDEGTSRLFLKSTSSVLTDEVRLLAPDGSIVASVPTVPSGQRIWTGCLFAEPGAVLAAVPLSKNEVWSFQSRWPSGYRVEARIGDSWRPAQLTFANCSSIE